MSVAQVAESLDDPVSGPEWRFFDAHGEHFDFIATLDRCIESRTALPRRVLGVRRPDGSLFWADTEVIPVQACRCGARWYAAIISTDLSERHFAEKVLRRLAFSDPLTGLANRFVLEDRLGQLSLRARGEGTPATLYYFDLDRFKPVNDRHGHEAGDAVLRHVAERLTKTFRREDTVARLGGDEFAVLARGVGDSAGRAARARRAVQSPMVISVDREAHPVSVGVSVGYVESGASSEPATLLQLADRAMYEDKRRRRVAE
jgi:diguanylate cyclase (GGDEF)-like protein